MTRDEAGAGPRLADLPNEPPFRDILGVAAEAILEQMPAGVIVARADGTIVFANDRVDEILGGPVPTGQLLDVAGYTGYASDGHLLDAHEWPLARALETGEVVTGEELTVRRADGRPILLRVSATPIRDSREEVVAGIVIFADVTAERGAREARSFLAEAAAFLGSSLDVEEIARGLAGLAVPRIADWCSVEILEPDGSLRQAAVAHVDPDRVALARELRARRPPEPDDPAGLHAVLRGRRPVLVEDIPPEVIEQSTLDDEERRLVRALSLRSLLMVPLVVAGEGVGVLNLITAESGRRFGSDDQALAEALGSRAAAAIQNAHLVGDLRRFKQVLDATQEGILIFDGPTRRVTYANHAATQLLGREPGGIVDRAIDDLGFDAGMRATRAAFRAVAARPGAVRRVTLRVQREERRYPVELILQGMSVDGSAGRVVGIARDIGERIAAAERMRRLAVGQRTRAAELDAVIRAIGDGIIVVAPDGRIRVANPAAERLLPGLEGRAWEDLVARLERAEVLGARPRAGEPAEFRRGTPDECWIEVAAYPIPETPGGRAGGADTIVVLRDVTEAHQRQLVRDTFLGILSHELRTPVTTIYGAAKVLARHPGSAESPRREELVADIAEEAERLHRLVENVIALTRFGDAPGDVGREPVLLQRIIPGAIAAERSRWPGVDFDVDLEAGLPTVIADPTYLEQVVRNLLGNAAKYAGEKGPIRVTAEATAGEVIVRVLDRGPGFDAEDAPRLFELYYRAQATAGLAAGAGIGLFVCSRLMSAMGGRIWGRPRAGGGSEFGLALTVMDDA